MAASHFGVCHDVPAVYVIVVLGYLSPLGMAPEPAVHGVARTYKGARMQGRAQKRAIGLFNSRTCKDACKCTVRFTDLLSTARKPPDTYIYIYVCIHTHVCIYIQYIYIYVFTRLRLVARLLGVLLVLPSFPMPPLPYCKMVGPKCVVSQSRSKKSHNKP